MIFSRCCLSLLLCYFRSAFGAAFFCLLTLFYCLRFRLFCCRPSIYLYCSLFSASFFTSGSTAGANAFSGVTSFTAAGTSAFFFLPGAFFGVLCLLLCLYWCCNILHHSCWRCNCSNLNGIFCRCCCFPEAAGSMLLSF